MESGSVRINTQKGASLTSDAVIGALALREQRRQGASALHGPSPFTLLSIQSRELRQKEDVDDNLGKDRHPRQADLDRTRDARRAIRKQLAAHQRLHDCA